jgi:hypothetical protein
MTVEAITPRIEYDGAGSPGPFAIPFYFLADAHIVAYRISALDEETELTLTTDYTLTGEGDEDGGSLTLVEDLVAGETLRIDRDTARTQASNWGRNDPFPAVASETAHDKLTLIVQELDQLISDLRDDLTTAELEGVDNFATHIIEGYTAIFNAVTLFYGQLSRWRFTTDASGNFRIAPHADDTSGDQILLLNPQGDVLAGRLNYRTRIRSLSDTAYIPLSSSDSAALLRMTSASAITITFQQDSDVVDPLADTFFTDNWGMIQRAGAGSVTIAAGTGVTITNGKTGGSTVTIPAKGGIAFWRRTGTNTYEITGEINARRVETVVAVTSVAGVLTLDWSPENVFTCTLTEDITSIIFNNLPSGEFQATRLRLTNHASSPKTVTGWPAGTKWRDGAAPTMTATNGAIDEIGLDCYGDGTTVLAKYIQNYQ